MENVYPFDLVPQNTMLSGKNNSEAMLGNVHKYGCCPRQLL